MADHTGTGQSTRSGLTAPVRHRDFRLLMGAFAISCAGSWAYNVALAVFVYEQTDSLTWVGAATIGRFVPSLVLGAYGGVLAERFERVRLMVAVDAACAVWMLLLALVAVLDGPVVLAIVLAALTSVFGTVYEPAVAAITPQTVPERDLAAANTLRNVVDNVAVIAGPALGALLLLAGPAALVFAVNGASFALSAVVVGRMTVRSRPVDVTEGGTVGPLRQMLVGFTAIGSSATATLLVLYSVVASFVYGVDTVQFISLSQQQLGTGADGYGYLLAGLGVGGVLAAGLVNRLAALPRLGGVILLGMALYCLPTLLFLVVSSPAAAFGIQGLRGAGTLVVDVLAVTALQRSLPPDLLGRVFGAFFTAVLAAISLGALVTPVVIATAGLDASLWLAGGLLPAACLLGLPWLRRMDDANVASVAALEPRIEALGRLGIFAEAGRPVLERLARTAVEQEVPAGTAVIARGRRGGRLLRAARGRDGRAVARRGQRGGRAAVDARRHLVRRDRPAAAHPPHGHRDRHGAEPRPADQRQRLPRGAVGRTGLDRAARGRAVATGPDAPRAPAAGGRPAAADGARVRRDGRRPPGAGRARLGRQVRREASCWSLSGVTVSSVRTIRWPAMSSSPRAPGRAARTAPAACRCRAWCPPRCAGHPGRSRTACSCASPLSVVCPTQGASAGAGR